MPNSLMNRLIVSLTTGLFLTAATANAEIQITVNGGNIDPGGSLLLEIGIDSNTPPGKLADYELVLQITPMTVTGDSSLQFIPAQSEAVLESADYVFAGDSDAVTLGEDLAFDNAGTSITFIDLTFSFLDVDVTSGQLLAMVDLKHQLGAATAAEVAGNTFLLSVDNENTFLSDSDFADIAFTSTPGTITVNAVAIPEPSFTALLMFGSCGLLVRRRRQSRTYARRLPA